MMLKALLNIRALKRSDPQETHANYFFVLYAHRTKQYGLEPLMKRTMASLSTLLLFSATAGLYAQSNKKPKTDPVTKPPQVAIATATKPEAAENGLSYTTYFYTSGEAVVHGYEANTKAKILSLENGAVIWHGTVNEGETVNVPTGPGVFGFLSEKKASILIGTPSSCTAIGYFVKNEEGSFLSKKFYTQLPKSVSMPSAKVLAWAWEDVSLKVYDKTDKEELFSGSLKAGQPYELDAKALGGIGSHVLAFSADKKGLSVQVYYDQGFVVPAKDGRASGRLFYTYVGDITTGENDLVLNAYDTPANVVVEDIQSKEVIYKGAVKAGQLLPITLTNRYVKVTSDAEISATVMAYQHWQGIYAEHHFSMGAEGTGIENNFLLATSNELWLFSYFNNTKIKVLDAEKKTTLWEGTLQAGNVKALEPGFGAYQVQSSAGISVMGGAAACDGEYSPAAGLFNIDEELMHVWNTEIKEARLKALREQKGTYTFEEEEKALAAPMQAAEYERAQDAVQKKVGRKGKLSKDEIQQRFDSIKKK
jgi:hypothetical protein